MRCRQHCAMPGIFIIFLWCCCPRSVFIWHFIYGSRRIIKLPERRCLLFCPALFLIGIVLTNDLHQLVFTFPEGRLGEAASYEVGVYGYGAMYYAIVAWDLGCLLAALLIILLRCRKIKNRKMSLDAFWCLWTVGCLWHCLLSESALLEIFSSDMTAALCLLFA